MCAAWRVSTGLPRAAAFRADPDVALAGLAEPVLVDEWQVVPEVLGAVKRRRHGPAARPFRGHRLGAS